MFDTWVDVLCNLPISNALSYRVPVEQVEDIHVGQRIQVRLRNKSQTAIIIKIHKLAPEFETFDIESIMDFKPVVNTDQIHLANWMADYYLAHPGPGLFKMFPAFNKWPRDHVSKNLAEYAPEHALNAEQSSIYESIHKGLEARRFQAHLLHGITGSGKTEIYIHSIMQVLNLGRSAILIVPEITLTVQLVDRLQRVFGEKLSLLHSGLAAKLRAQNYLGLLEGRSKIVVGTRSAIFAPLENIGIIIIDEEHDGSFKEHSSPRYDARQVAFKRAQDHQALLVMGSATPRLETWHHFCHSEQGDYVYHRLDSRATGASLATIEILQKKNHGIPISGPLHQAIAENFKSGGKTLLLLNRRGYNPVVFCNGCDEIEKCPHCAVNMNLHNDGRLICHYCGYFRKYDGLCSCERRAPLKPTGSGTQKLEEYLLNLIPSLRLERLDTDQAAKRGFAQESIARLINGELDVLIGTQMIAKGLDVPEVTLVGVLQADAGLAMPDFRAAERSFALLTQVAGRSGRGQFPGRVILECLQMDDPVVLLASHQDYEGFCQQEIKIRKMMMYPPFSRLIRLLVRGKLENKVEKTIEQLYQMICMEFTTELASNATLFKILGPVKAPMEKLHNQYRHHIIIKFQGIGALKPRLRQILANISQSGIYIEVDIDPVDLL